jgi:hypothetical protein
MKPVTHHVVTALLAAFGALTVFMSGSVIFDLFGIRAREGHYVLFIVLINFCSGFLFLAAALAFFLRHRLAVRPLVVSLTILILGLIGLIAYIKSGGVYEQRTVGAMVFRIFVNSLLAWLVYYFGRNRSAAKTESMLVVLVTLLPLVAGCGRQPADTASHDAVHAHDEGGPSREPLVLRLNNGEKWHADRHTMFMVQQMEAELSDFERTGAKDYQVLADSLAGQLNRLVAGCTMEGPAHDELHKWLAPLLEDAKSLASPNEASQAASVSAIRHSLVMFHQFFEKEGN